MTEWRGGCLCGKVRFQLAGDPFDAGWCHCRNCQLASGSPAMVFAAREIDFAVPEGADAQLRALQVHEDGDRAVDALLERADDLDPARESSSGRA